MIGGDATGGLDTQGKGARGVRDDGRNKIFVGGLSQEITQETFDDYFSLYGELVDSVVMKDKATGRSRGFGFVKYAEESAAEKVMEDASSHSIDGNTVEVKRCVPKQGGGNGDYHGQAKVWAQAPAARPRREPQAPQSAKVFVGGIGADSTTESLSAYFSQYGELVDAVVMVDKQTNRNRGFGFVKYADIESAEAVMEAAGSHELDGKSIEVKRCVPKDDDFQGGQKGGHPMHAPPHFVHVAPQGKGKHQQPMMMMQPMRAAPSMAFSAMRTDKIFIGGLGQCNEDVLVSYFGQYNIVDVVVMRDKVTGRSKGFGFVQFDHFGAVDEIMQFGQPHHIDGRMIEVSGNHCLNGQHVEVKRSIPKEAMAATGFRPHAGGPSRTAAPRHFDAPPAYQAPPQKGFGKAPAFGKAPHKGCSGKGGGGKASPSEGGDKLFVGGLGQSCSEEEFVEYFSQFGTLIDHVVMKDRETGRSRGFGFVTYDDPSAVEQILSRYREHQIGGKWIEVKKTDGKSGDKGKGRSMPY